MSPGSSTESYPTFARIGLRENPGKNLNQVTCPDRDSNPGHLVSQPDVLTVTPQHSLKWVKGKRSRPVCPVVQQEEVESIPTSSYECTKVQCVLRGLTSVDLLACKRTLASRAVASRSKASGLGFALRNARWFESSWEKKFPHEISTSVWDRCPPSIVMHLGSYNR
ncbi:hypothetical protein ANN_05541 [Periplaneta americana]|uniref:Uncharacterized protein n=1 Tax=Periplaneta americana TaxID=6978 RepID=A0ABQ8TCW6_PERAM|nr:hypothetical protein ANN_05541 [Periplaneta americana]